MKETLILVTGGAGFLGSNLCKVLVKQGNYVVCMDNLFTGQKENIKDLLDKDNFVFIEHDVTEPIPVTTIFNFKTQKCTAAQLCQIYNLACPASPMHYQADPVKTLKTNVFGAIHVLELANSTNAVVLQASTSEVYGDSQVSPQPESYRGNVNPIGIRACYDEGKRAAETLFFDYQRMYGVIIKVIRIFNTYGPNMHPQDGRVVSNFIIQAMKNEDITIYGDGMQTRSFCFVSDLIQGMIRLMNSSSELHGPINMGNTEEFTIKALAELVIHLLDSKSKIAYMPLPEDDPYQRKPDIAQAKQMLGWEPQIRLHEGLEKTIRYFKERLEK
ncbi:MAG: SDR family oxidoreductase [Hungatella sp.]|nr:SDR family oxidoreductase [Hungatella sp.]